METRRLGMTVEEAVKILDKHIPAPNNRMVDLEHLNIAVAWKTIKEHIAPVDSGGDKEGICPVCGGELEYRGIEVGDDGGVEHCECRECGATGDQGYDEVFDGHHYNVRDADGKPIPGREE